MDDSIKSKLPPLYLGAAIIAADQAVKALIVGLSHNKIGVLARWGKDLVYILHQRNLGAAFSMLDGLSPAMRFIVLGILPVFVLAAVLIFYFRTSELSKAQSWALLAMVGGGIGNLIDRLFRPLGVVDFISVKFFGIFGLDRWPTFNIADSAVVVGAVAMILTFIAQGLGQIARRRRNGKEGSPQ
jgi:signal peptidase II